MVIGISGSALSGKNLFARLLARQLTNRFAFKVKEYALADSLKRDLQPFLLETFGIDIFNCSSDLKNKVRNLLVTYADIRRKESQGRHFIEVLHSEIKKDNSRFDLQVITDLRFCFYPKDELCWLKNELNGKLVYLDKYWLDLNGGKLYQPPANEEEARNNPILKQKADIKIEWENCDNNPQLIEQKLIPIVNNVVAEILPLINAPSN